MSFSIFSAQIIKNTEYMQNYNVHAKQYFLIVKPL